MIIKRFFKVNSNEIVLFKSTLNFSMKNFEFFVTFYKNFHTRLRSQVKKNFSSGSSKKLLLHRLWLRNTACEVYLFFRFDTEGYKINHQVELVHSLDITHFVRFVLRGIFNLVFSSCFANTGNFFFTHAGTSPTVRFIF
jgi:hypothetical protein